MKYLTEREREAKNMVVPRPDAYGGRWLADGGEACHMCWGSGEGDWFGGAPNPVAARRRMK